MRRRTTLNCKRIEPGMFSDEATVTITLSDGTEDCFVVAQDLIDVQKGALLIEVVHDFQKTHTNRLVLLPTQYRRMVNVPTAHLNTKDEQ